MHIPGQFNEARQDRVLRLIDQYPLGLLMSFASGRVEADQLPFERVSADDGSVILRAHFGRWHPLLTRLPNGGEVTIAFQGEQGYISPNWYPSKRESHRQVPTWNYQAVHVYGELRWVRDELWMREHLEGLTKAHEASESNPWTIDEAPVDYVKGMIEHLVGLEIFVTKIEAKSKLSQNKEPRDFQGAVESLRAIGKGRLADAMVDARPPELTDFAWKRQSAS